MAIMAFLLKEYANEEVDISKLRYHKIIIMTDADVDGAHIRTLMLTFFFRYARPMIEDGYVYIAQPPLFKITSGKTSEYLYDEKALDKMLKERGIKSLSLSNKNRTITKTGEELIALLGNMTTYYKSYNNPILNIIPEVVLRGLMRSDITAEDFEDQAKMTATKAASSLMQVGTDYESDSLIAKKLQERQYKLKLLEEKLDLQKTEIEERLEMINTELKSNQEMIHSGIQESFTYKAA